MLSLSFPQGMHLTVPLSTLPLLGGLSSLQDVPPKKSLDRSRRIGLFPFPDHQTIPPLPLTSGPWPHHVPYWLGTGWWSWVLRMLSFQICPKICLLLMRLSWSGGSPSVFLDLLCGLFFVFPLHSRARLCLMMGLTFLWPTPWFSLFLTMLYCYSCHNNLILLSLFWASRLFLLSVAWHGHCFYFYLWAPVSL